MPISEKRIVIAGGGGFIGGELSRTLSTLGYEVVLLSRSPDKIRLPVRTVRWDGKALGPWTCEVDGARAVINLAGKNVNCRYTRRNLHEIDQSRVDAVTVMAHAINACRLPPPVLVQAGTTAIYGDRGDEPLDDTAAPGVGVPVKTALAWEDAFHAHATPDTRRVLLRISFALGPSGGVLKTLATLARCYLGGTVGNGRQMISWIHTADLNRMFQWAIERDHLTGTYNAATPFPVTNAQFMRELRRALHRPWAPPTPAWAVHAGAVVLRTEPVLALTGRRAVPRRFLEEGFEFNFPRLPEALDQLLA